MLPIKNNYNFDPLDSLNCFFFKKIINLFIFLINQLILLCFILSKLLKIIKYKDICLISKNLKHILAFYTPSPLC